MEKFFYETWCVERNCMTSTNDYIRLMIFDDLCRNSRQQLNTYIGISWSEDSFGCIRISFVTKNVLHSAKLLQLFSSVQKKVALKGREYDLTADEF